MIVFVDGAQLKPDPQYCAWSPPPVLAKDGAGSPIYGPYYSCTLSVPLTTGANFEPWFELADSETHDVQLPHPATGTLTTFTDVYIDIVTPGQFDLRQDCPAQAGIDMIVSKIVVTI